MCVELVDLRLLLVCLGIAGVVLVGYQGFFLGELFRRRPVVAWVVCPPGGFR